MLFFPGWMSPYFTSSALFLLPCDRLGFLFVASPRCNTISTRARGLRISRIPRAQAQQQRRFVSTTSALTAQQFDGNARFSFAVTAVAVDAIDEQPPLSCPLISSILTPLLEGLSSRQLRTIVDSPANRDLELHLSKKDAAAARAEAKLRELLETVLRIVAGGNRDSAVKILLNCPTLLLCDASELLAKMQELRDLVSTCLLLFNAVLIFNAVLLFILILLSLLVMEMRNRGSFLQF